MSEDMRPLTLPEALRKIQELHHAVAAREEERDEARELAQFFFGCFDPHPVMKWYADTHPWLRLPDGE